MARARDLRVTISGDARGLSKGTRKAEKDLARLQRVGVSSTRGLSAAFKGAGSIIAGAAIADQIRQTIVAAQEAEVSQKKLATQLKASGISYQAHAKQIDTVIQKTSQLAGLDDEDLQDAFTNIVRVTGNVNKSLRLTGLAADFARAKHIDVAKAGEIVGKVAGGNVGILSRYGITIRKGASATEALGALQRKFAGQAAAYGKTSAGAQDRFRVAVENLRESIGAKLLPVITRLTNKAATFVNQMQSGTGAGGRFAAKLREIADRIKPIAKFFGDHPKLIAIAVGAWATYRVAAALALTASRLKLIGMFSGLGPKAAAGGAVAGRSFGGAAATSAGTTFSRRAPGAFGGGRMSGAMRGAGTALGAILGAAMIGELISKIEGDKGTILNTLRGILPFSPQPGHPKVKPFKPRGNPSPVKSPGGPLRPNVQVTPSPGVLAAPDNRPRAKTSSVMGHAASRTRRGGPVAVASGAEPHPDDIVAAITGRADRIDAAHVPYLWGGGHGGKWGGGRVIPMDCSGAVSAALGIDPRVSGQFTTWGSPGDGGSRGITVYANATHVLMKINGRFWGTSRSNPGGGPGWIEGGVPAGYLARFTARHMEGSGSGSTAASGATGGASSRRPKSLTAKAGGVLSRVPGRMGGKLPGRTPGVAKGGFVATPTLAELDLLSSDNPVMRQFQIATRLNTIDQAITTGKIKRPEKLTELLEERKSLKSELTDLLKPPDTDTTDSGGGEDPNQPLIDAQNQAAEAARAQTDALNALKDEFKHFNDRAAAVGNVEMGQLAKGLADFISGQIGGFGYGGRVLTASGGGASVRY